MGILNECQEYFKTKSLYDVLGVAKSATEKELKQAYYKKSLKVHPDRVEEKDKKISTIKFQILGKIYVILSDKDKRSVYDELGEVDDENLPEEKDWDHYWRLRFKKINLNDIKEFEKNYKGSEEELADLKEAYTDGKGDWKYIFDNVLCSTYEDENRFEKIIKSWIKDKYVEDFPKFSKETKKQKDARKKKATKEAKEAEEMKKDLGLDDAENDLQKLILKRQSERQESSAAFFDHLAEKYAKPASKKKKTK